MLFTQPPFSSTPQTPTPVPTLSMSGTIQEYEEYKGERKGKRAESREVPSTPGTLSKMVVVPIDEFRFVPKSSASNHILGLIEDVKRLRRNGNLFAPRPQRQGTRDVCGSGSVHACDICQRAKMFSSRDTRDPMDIRTVLVPLYHDISKHGDGLGDGWNEKIYYGLPGGVGIWDKTIIPRPDILGDASLVSPSLPSSPSVPQLTPPTTKTYPVNASVRCPSCKVNSFSIKAIKAYNGDAVPSLVWEAFACACEDIRHFVYNGAVLVMDRGECTVGASVHITHLYHFTSIGHSALRRDCLREKARAKDEKFYPTRDV